MLPPDRRRGMSSRRLRSLSRYAAGRRRRSEDRRRPADTPAAGERLPEQGSSRSPAPASAEATCARSGLVPAVRICDTVDACRSEGRRGSRVHRRPCAKSTGGHTSADPASMLYPLPAIASRRGDSQQEQKGCERSSQRHRVPRARRALAATAWSLGLIHTTTCSRLDALTPAKPWKACWAGQGSPTEPGTRSAAPTTR
jgi:hypothetical protein